MSVHYKFKNTIDYNAVKFDGVQISAADLKAIIAQQKKLGQSELQISNEETKQIYNDDHLIPKNTNVIVLRLPHANASKRSRQQHANNQHHNNNRASNHGATTSNNSSNTNGASSMLGAGLGGGREAMELVVANKNMTEEERLKYIQSQSIKDFDPSRYARGGGRGGYRGGGRGGTHRNYPPRPGYCCNRCGIPGHLIQDCKSTIHKHKRSSGIPKAFLQKVDSKEKGALMTPSGEFAVPIIDLEAYKQPKVEKAPFFEDGIPEDNETQSDVKPDIKALQVSVEGKNSSIVEAINEQGQKRSYDVAIREQDQDSKKSKLGFAVPNWRNITKSDTPDADRYAQYPMVEVRSRCETLVTTYERRLLDMPMYAISTNVLCRHTKDGKDIYIPIEIGIHAYSMSDGHLGKTYHCMIDSGPVPSGQVNKTREHTEATHRISNPSKGSYPPEARRDYLNIYKEMYKYVRGGQRTVLVPDEHDMNQVTGCLEWLWEKASVLDPMLPRVSTWSIFPMVEYIAAAYNFVQERILHQPRIFTIHYIIKIKQESSTWDYEEQYSCRYHRSLEEQTKWCAKSCATKAFLNLEEILESLARTYRRATDLEKDQQHAGTDSSNYRQISQQSQSQYKNHHQKEQHHSYNNRADPRNRNQLTYR